MSYTVGKKIPRKHRRRGVYVALCGYCGAPYYPSQLRRLRNGHLACFGPGTQNDARGKDEVTQAEGNARAATYWYQRSFVRHEGGNFDDDSI